MLFGMYVSKYALNKKSFEIMERASFKSLLYFYILQRNNKSFLCVYIIFPELLCFYSLLKKTFCFAL